MSRKVGITRFLGTNCDRDIWQAVEFVGKKPQWMWYADQYDLGGWEAIIVPGGFSYGDYLRCGALAARSPVMSTLREADKKGIPILGICNGFQILCEAALLPGLLVRNKNQRFIDQWVTLNLFQPCSFWGGETQKKVKMPIAHGEGCFCIEPDGLKKIQDKGQVWWTYKTNPNGSMGDIAGVMNEKKNVAALMPHPERALFDWMGGAHGKAFFCKEKREL